MRFPACGLFLGCLLAGSLMLGVACSNTFNPLCSSARPAPLIQSLSPSSVSFADVQQGATLTVDGSQFVSATQVMINSTTLGATVLSPKQLTVKLSTDVITGPGSVKVMVVTPAGNTGDLGCTSGGKSSVLTLTVN